MPIPVTCPSCGVKAKAPDAAAGRAVKCPKCGAVISVSPAAPPPAPPTPQPAPVQSRPPAKVGAAEAIPPKPRPAQVEAAEPEPAKAVEDCPYCGEEVLAGAKKCKHCGEALDAPPPADEGEGRGRKRGWKDEDDEDRDEPRKRPRRDDRDEEEEEDERPAGRGRRGSSAGTSDACGIASVVLGGVSMVLALLSCCTCGFSAYVAGPLALVGGVLAFYARQNLRVVGLIFNALALIPALILSVLFAMGLTLSALNPLGTAKGPGAGDVVDLVPDMADWPDGTQQDVTHGDLSVRITSAEVGPVALTQAGRRSLSADKHLIVRLRLRNTGATKTINYKDWADKDPLNDEHAGTLEDNFGDSYEQVSFPAGSTVDGQLKRATIQAGKAAEDVLVFDKPAENVEYLRLELPASAIGGDGKLRLRIPAEAIRR